MPKKKISPTENQELETSETVAIASPVEDSVNDQSAAPTENEAVEIQVSATDKKQSRTRGKKYVAARSKVDKTKKYSLSQAVELLKELSYSKFDGTMEAHLQVKETGASANLTFPHSTGKSVKVAIADEQVLDNLSKGIIDFDVLLATPGDMKNLTKYARLLGPKGLMPNPKNGTVSPNPEAKKKELEAGSITVKTERKAPLIHVAVGKVSMETPQLEENIRTLIKSFDNKIVKLKLSATMSPSVTVDLG